MTTNPPDPVKGLEALGDLAHEVDDANPTPEQKQLQAQEETKLDAVEQGAKDWAMIPFTIGNTLAMLAPELKQVYSEQNCLEWGGCMHKVAVKYGWPTIGAPELAVAAMTINMAVPTILVLRAKLQLMREGKEAGMFGKLVLWYRQRKAAKAAGAGQADQVQPAGAS